MFGLFVLKDRSQTHILPRTGTIQNEQVGEEETKADCMAG
jgi:hypothetical protein